MMCTFTKKVKNLAHNELQNFRRNLQSRRNISHRRARVLTRRQRRTNGG